MIIVANTFILNIFRKIPLFKINLGTSLVDMKQEKIVIKDPFILKYFNMTGKQTMTYGTIGKLNFYQDYTLPSNEFYVFNDDTIYSLNYTSDDASYSPENYLASIVQEINEKEGIKESSDTINRVKNPDIKLPADQYIQEMIKKRKLENG
jgi:hypothetical protein